MIYMYFQYHANSLPAGHPILKMNLLHQIFVHLKDLIDICLGGLTQMKLFLAAGI